MLGGIETYFTSCLMADDKIIWKHVSGPILEETQDMLKEFSIAVFGECGQGKSTLLSKISDIYREKFDVSSEALEFFAKKSLVAITSNVKMAKRGNMTLIDSPGMNDPNKTRSDK